jgi:hypothetical protein
MVESGKVSKVSQGDKSSQLKGGELSGENLGARENQSPATRRPH